MARLLLVSNRLPVTVSLASGGVTVKSSIGGLATGLKGPHERSGGLWLGWPGDTAGLTDSQRERLEQELSRLHAVPLYLSPSEVDRFYEGFSNGVLWPVFHYLIDRIPLRARDWAAYRAVNQRFADLAARHYRPGDLIWVHDYQLSLVPGMLREQLPEARIGFFLHIPFPASEVFRLLPCREELLEGLLGADLVGFHTLSYARHFGNSLLHVLGLTPDVDRVLHRGRQVRFGAYPMGVDADSFAELAASGEVASRAAQIRSESPGHRLIVGIDRLDYTKGILRRLLAVERLLERDPTLRGRLRFIQVAVPSRTKIDEYASFRQQANETVSRINGRFGTPTSVPIHYLFRSFSRSDLAALYRSAEVMLVTPLRDGMNLVAKEYVASRTDEDGVLVLSEFAGAASELGEALQVNPYDIDAVAEAIAHALSMPRDERRARMRALRERVFDCDVHRWAETFIEDLTRSVSAEPGHRLSSSDELHRAVAELRSREHRLVLLDYDGTLVPFEGRPELAAPDPTLRTLLGKVAAAPGTAVHVVSGRPRDLLERWLGDLPLGLHAEHGVWSRLADGWTGREVRIDWMKRVHDILHQFALRTPGSFVEEKTASLAWHWRMADIEFGARQARELHIHLSQTLSNVPVEIVTGDMVIEVLPHSINKGVVAESLVAAAPGGCAIIAIGDDQADERLFAALPPDAITVHVGPQSSRASLRVADAAATRALLEELVDDGGS